MVKAATTYDPIADGDLVVINFGTGIYRVLSVAANQYGSVQVERIDPPSDDDAWTIVGERDLQLHVLAMFRRAKLRREMRAAHKGGT